MTVQQGFHKFPTYSNAFNACFPMLNHIPFPMRELRSFVPSCVVSKPGHALTYKEFQLQQANVWRLGS